MTFSWSPCRTTWIAPTGNIDLNPIRNLFNEWYARDISKKRRISNKIMGAAGEPLGRPPYGYRKDPNDSKRWVVDEAAARIVRRIYSMTLDGKGSEQIADALTWEKILSPIHYWESIGVNRPGKKPCAEPCRWNCSTIMNILTTQEYCSDVINFKTYSKSFKNKKRIENASENWLIFKDVHEPIIDRATWERVLQKRGKVRKRKTKDGESNMFSGLLVCADCGCNLGYHFNQGNPDIRYFNCQNYNKTNRTCDSTHYIRVDFLEEVVLQEIRRLTRFASKYETAFVNTVMGQSRQTAEQAQQFRKKELSSLRARDRELDALFERMYEDNVSGKISDERFRRMSKRYEDEQAELQQKATAMQKEIEQSSDSTGTTEHFIATVRQYARAKKLTPRMLNELIHHIEVYQAERVNGVQVQKLTIHYNCVGTIEIPDFPPLARPDITMQTRKGVAVSYAPMQNAG